MIPSLCPANRSFLPPLLFAVRSTYFLFLRPCKRRVHAKAKDRVRTYQNYNRTPLSSVASSIRTPGQQNRQQRMRLSRIRCDNKSPSPSRWWKGGSENVVKPTSRVRTMWRVQETDRVRVLSERRARTCKRKCVALGGGEVRQPV